MKSTLIILTIILHTAPITAQQLQVDGGPIQLPRLTSSEINAITPTAGQLVYNSDKDKVQVYASKSYSTTSMENTGVCLQYQAFTPPDDFELQSVEFYRNLSGTSGSVKIVQGKPCNIERTLGTTNTITAVPGWNKYSFNTTVNLEAGSTYYFATNSGFVCADYSNEDNPHFGQHFFVNSDCLKETGLTVRVNGRGWVNLH